MTIVLTAGANRSDWGAPTQTPDRPDPETEEFHEQICQFARAFPESPYLRPVDIGDPTDPDRLRDAVRPFLEDRSAAIGELNSRVAGGELPAGILADITNHHYAELLILRAYEGQIACIADPTIDQAERAAAGAAMASTADVMIEASALLTTSHSENTPNAAAMARRTIRADDHLALIAGLGSTDKTTAITIMIDPSRG